MTFIKLFLIQLITIFNYKGNKKIRIFTDLLFLSFIRKFLYIAKLKMKSFRNWIVNLFEGMAFAFVHPVKNYLPPNIGAHSYRDKPYKGHKGLWFS